MSTAPTVPMVSVEEYLNTSYEPHCEYVDGLLLPKAVSDYTHTKLQKLLLLFLASQEEKLGLEGLAELHIRVTPTRFRIPDFCAITETPADGRYPDTPPLFTIEIASLEEPWPALRGKVRDHLAMGVPLIIIADPYNRTVMVATQSAPLREISPPLIVDIPVPNGSVLPINFDELYGRL